MVFKRCKYEGCGARCSNPNHPLWFKVSVNGVTERGPATKYLALLKVGQPVPRTIEEGKTLEALIKVWVANGRDPQALKPVDTEGDSSTPATVADLLKAYDDAYVNKLANKSAKHITARLARELGTLTPAQLFE